MCPKNVLLLPSPISFHRWNGFFLHLFISINQLVMKNIRRGAFTLLVALCAGIYSCGPTDDKGGMDQENSDGEGAVDSSRLTNSDTAAAAIFVPNTKAAHAGNEL